MRIRLLSDLHLEQHPHVYEALDEDVVILAGDISENDDVSLAAYDRLLASIRVPVYAIPGNHEPWHSPDRAVWRFRVLDVFKRHAHARWVDELMPSATLPDGTGLAGCMLHTDHRTREMSALGEAIRQHERNGKRVVVVTHTVPALSCVYEETPDGRMLHDTSMVCAHLGERLITSAVTHWFFGHQHRSVHRRIGIDGRVLAVANPKGSPEHGVNPTFNPHLIIELP